MGSRQQQMGAFAPNVLLSLVLGDMLYQPIRGVAGGKGRMVTDV